MMTKKEAAVFTVYANTFLIGKDMDYIFDYASKLIGRPLGEHELTKESKRLRELAKPDFVKLCKKIAEKEK